MRLKTLEISNEGMLQVDIMELPEKLKQMQKHLKIAFLLDLNESQRQNKIF